ncbi:MAG: hydroxyacid-oxoacid transhydrogenase [Polyangia bacterium]
MSCCHYFQPSDGGDTAFSVDGSAVTFGHGALDEVGDHARALGLRRVALFTDRAVGGLVHVARVTASLRAAGVDVGRFDEVRIEPSDRSFLHAARFFRDGRFDGAVSVGGGSVMDTCKAALLYATYPADFLAYVNKPVGGGVPVPGPLPPHLACPTTCGTGSECTGIAIAGLFDSSPARAAGSSEARGPGHLKVGIAHRSLRPTRALIDPACALTLPAAVVAASGFDVLCHALESYTALPYTQRARPERGTLRPMSQGANPFSDVGSLEALRLCGRYFLRAVRDAQDHEAREQLMYAATLAGIAFGNAGVHVPHGMAYSIAGLVRDFRMPGYPAPDAPDHQALADEHADEHAAGALVPHGVSVILAAPAVFRVTAAVSPERHLTAAQALGVDLRGVDTGQAGAAGGIGARLAAHLVSLMQATSIPNGLGAVGYRADDVEPLTAMTLLSTRLLQNAPCALDRDALAGLFRDALAYW